MANSDEQLWDQRAARLALDVLREKRKATEEQYKQDIADIDHAIKAIGELDQALKVIEEDTKSSRRNGVPGRMKGMPIREAMQLILAKHDGPMPLPVLVAALIQGGVNLGTRPKRYTANVKTTIANNAKRFNYSKDTDTIALATQ